MSLDSGATTADKYKVPLYSTFNALFSWTPAEDAPQHVTLTYSTSSHLTHRPPYLTLNRSHILVILPHWLINRLCPLPVHKIFRKVFISRLVVWGSPCHCAHFLQPLCFITPGCHTPALRSPAARRGTAMAVNVTMGRDTKWLTLEVCREFQRGTCSRSDNECKFAHPSRTCHVENGRVIACFDSLKVTRMHVHADTWVCFTIALWYINH